MKTIKLSDDELALLRHLVSDVEQKFKKDEKSIIEEWNPRFIKGEVKSEDFLSELKEKLQ